MCEPALQGYAVEELRLALPRAVLPLLALPLLRARPLHLGLVGRVLCIGVDHLGLLVHLDLNIDRARTRRQEAVISCGHRILPHVFVLLLLAILVPDVFVVVIVAAALGSLTLDLTLLDSAKPCDARGRRGDARRALVRSRSIA